MKNFLLSLLVIILFASPVFSLEFDLSVDEEIKKKYNSNKLNEEVLPSLPSNLSTPSKSSSNTSKNSNVSPSNATYQSSTVKRIVNYKVGAKIPAWTKFSVKSNVKINNWLAKGSSVSFISVYSVNKNSVTIPSGTVFTGIISDVHHPQLAGNGALVEISINSMRFSGKTIPVSAKVTKANGKKIFFNSIKGKHQYLSSVKKQVVKGENFYNKSHKMAVKLASNPVGIILSPIPTVVGWVGYAVCTVASPVTGLGGKGGTVSIPVGSTFEIKLLESAYLQ